MYLNSCLASLLLLGDLVLSAMPFNASGTYTVPASDRLNDVATIEVDDYQVFMDENDRHFVSFTLPPELVGSDAKKITLGEISSKKKSGFEIWASSQAEMHCSGSWENKACIVRFKKPGGSLEAAKTYIEERYDTQEGILRTDVAKAFHSEPIGLVSLHKK